MPILAHLFSFVRLISPDLKVGVLRRNLDKTNRKSRPNWPNRWSPFRVVYGARGRGWHRLAVGQEARVQAAWLRFPGFTLEPLEQLYQRIEATTYHYESASGRFVTDIQVNETGFVTRYPNIWQAEI
jgi:hypothetical protein